MLPCLVPWGPQIMQIGISFWSCSGAEHSLEFWAGSFLSRLQACISFYRVSNKRLLFLPCSHKKPLLISEVSGLLTKVGCLHDGCPRSGEQLALLSQKPGRTNTWGQKRYSQEFVFPSLWRSSGELFGVKSCKTLHFVCVWQARIVQKISGKCSDDSLLLEVRSPKHDDTRYTLVALQLEIITRNTPKPFLLRCLPFGPFCVTRKAWIETY